MKLLMLGNKIFSPLPSVYHHWTLHSASFPHPYQKADPMLNQQFEFFHFTAGNLSLQRLCFYTCLSVILFTGGRVSQHALQVVSQHALQVSRGCVYPSIPCRFPGPHPRGGGLRGLARGIYRPTPRGVSRPTPRGGCIPVCSEADPLG